MTLKTLHYIHEEPAPAPEETATDNTATDNDANSETDRNKRNCRLIPKSAWRRMKKAELKKQINLVNNLSYLQLTENHIK